MADTRTAAMLGYGTGLCGDSVISHDLPAQEGPARGESTMLDQMTAPVSQGTAIRPFTIDVPQAELDDLRRRIVATRWPDKETVEDDSQGVPLALMQDLARYWATDYNWRKMEARLNSFPNFVTEIDGLDIHFIHVRSKHENALPLV